MALNFNDGTNPATEEEKLRQLIVEVRDKLARYEAGADPTPVPEGVAGTTGQLWHKMLQADEAGRFRLLGWFMEIAERSSSCFAQNHQGSIDQLQFELQDVQAKLSATLGFDTPQSLHSLTVAVQALRNVMVDGLAARAQILTAEDYPSDLLEYDEDLPQEPSVQEKIGEQLKAAGIDTSATCGYEWNLTDEHVEHDISTVHRCTMINPLHAESHVCGNCGTVLTHDQAERLVMEAGK